MEKEINFLKAVKKSAKQLAFQRRLRVGTILTMIVYILAVIGVFSFHFFVARREKGILGEVASQEKRISELQPVESLQLTVGSRLKVLTKIFDKEKNKLGLAKAMETVLILVGSEVIVSGYELGDYGNSIDFSGAVETPASLIRFFETLQEKPELEDVFISGLRKSAEGYSFQITIKLS